MKKITYTKKDIIDEIQSNNNISESESRVMVELVINAFKKFLLKKEKNFRIEISMNCFAFSL